MKLLNLFVAGWAALASVTASCSTDPLPAKDPQINNPETETPAQKDDNGQNDTNEETTMKVTITVAGNSFTATIEDSETGNAFMGKLPMTLEMSELNGNEKYCYGVSLPNNDKRYDSIKAGDLMLYSGNCIVLFYVRG